jgi:hypothetical protein
LSPQQQRALLEGLANVQLTCHRNAKFRERFLRVCWPIVRDYFLEVMRDFLADELPSAVEVLMAPANIKPHTES